MTFDVLKEPWIPLTNGQTVSLLDALAQAHTVEGVQCDSPLETVAVYRLMIAFVMDALTLPHRDARLALLRQGHFDMAVVRDYVTRCEREGAYFDLFDAKRPFMQAAYDPAYDGENKKNPAAVMALRMPSGNYHVFFDHQHEARFTPAEALREMLTSNLYCTIGGQGYHPSLNGTPCYYVLHRGENLFQTLVYNMLSQAECGNIDYGKPAWREEQSMLLGEGVPSLRMPFLTMLAALTWQPRRITLPPDTDGRVSTIYFQPGRWLEDKNIPWQDPHVPYWKLKNGKFMAMIPKIGRDFWKDFDAVNVSKSDKSSMPPLALLNALAEKPWYSLLVAGIVTNQQSKLEIIAHDRLMVPNELLKNEEYREELEYCLKTIENGANALEIATKRVWGEEPKKTKQKRFGSAVIAPALSQSYFQQAGTYVSSQYLSLLLACRTDPDFVALRKAVANEVMRMMRHTVDRLHMRLGGDGRKLTVQAKINQLACAIYWTKQK